MRRWIALLLALGGTSAAFGADAITSTRVSAFDFQTQDANGVKISDHTRFDTALVACLNNPACVFVAGGKYRITRGTAAAPTPAPTPTPSPVPQPPAPTVGTASITWTPPTQNTDGSPLTNLAGYKLYHGTVQGSFPDMMVFTASVTSYIYQNLASGTHYFAVSAFTSGGVESGLSAIGSKVVP